LNPLRLRTSVAKSAGSWAREVSLDDTWSKITAIREQFGLTKIYDLTGLDTLNIPVYSAITPFGNDTITVYHGKGLTPLAAQVSAAMEAFERNAAALPMRPVRIASVAQLRSEGVAHLDPEDFHVRTSARYHHDLPISWIESWDLLESGPVLVPHHGAAYGRSAHEPAVFHVITTSGIASGNSIEEAIAHALCEVIERDVVTLRKVADTCHAQSGGSVGSPRRPLDLSDVPPVARDLVDRFIAAEVDLSVEHLASDLDLPVFAAISHDPQLGTQVGYGASPDATLALVRALTECAQSRAGELERLREDVQLVGTSDGSTRSRTDGALVRRPITDEIAPVGTHQPGWDLTSQSMVHFADVPSYEHDDIVADIALLTQTLREAGLSRILVCDMTPPDAPFSVVRVIVPGLETWAFDNSKLGQRALDAWNDQAARSSEMQTVNGSPIKNASL
jgi:ribosomal protein S12 methylthiotransferase accessory factor